MLSTPPEQLEAHFIESEVTTVLYSAAIGKRARRIVAPLVFPSY
jgi:hypothetical protein